MTIGAYQETTPRLFVQGLYDESATALQRIGTVRELDDGRKFVYAKAGASALAVAKLTQQVAHVGADHLECVVSDTAIGQTRIYLTLNGTTNGVTANQYKDGFLWINKNTGIGHLYKIRGHAAAAAGGAFYMELYDPIRVATASSAECSLMTHPQAGVVIHPSPPTGALAGVPPRAVTAAYYFWNQVKGVCSILTVGTIVAGKAVVPSLTVDGGVDPPALSEGTPNTAFDQQVCGTVLVVNITAEYSLINLNIPGY